jgi:hypothetical protein
VDKDDYYEKYYQDDFGKEYEQEEREEREFQNIHKTWREKKQKDDQIEEDFYFKVG